MSNFGLIFLDNSSLRLLATDEALRRLEQNCRVADLTVHISAINALEGSATHGRHVATAVRDLLVRLGGDRAMLPMPDDLLRLAGQQVLRGESFFTTGWTGYEWMLLNESERGRRHAELAASCKSMQDGFAKFHQSARIEFRGYLRKKGIRDFVESSTEFLEWFWTVSSLPEAFAELTWGVLAMGEDFPGPSLLEHEIWRLFLDGEAVALYERALAFEQPKAVHQLDIWQLLYLAGGQRRVFLTADDALLRVGNAVVRGRYACARLLHPETFLSLATA